MPGFASTNTSVPSAGGFPARDAFRRNMQHFTWLLRSRRVKYQCPLDHALHWMTSPRTHIGGNSPVTRRLIAVLSCATVQTWSAGDGVSSESDKVMDKPGSVEMCLLHRLESVLQQHGDSHRPNPAGNRCDCGRDLRDGLICYVAG